MQTQQPGAVELSRLMLGTVQFGLPYGVANRTGQPSYQEVVAILACAYEGGVNCLDTAAIYGQSEEVLGEALAELGIADEMIVVTKISPIADGVSSSQAFSIVEESVASSLRRLQLESIPFCLFHHETNFCYFDSLLKLQERGWVGRIGCSVSTPSAAAPMLASGKMEAMQLPANLFDHRFRRAQLFQAARESRIALFVRSAYLQGLLVMAEEDIPAELLHVVPLRRVLEKLAHEAGLEMSEMAARYALGLEGTTSVVVGVESLEQMQANLALFSKPPLPESLMQAINEIVPELPDQVLLPKFWSNRMPDVVPARSAQKQNDA